MSLTSHLGNPATSPIGQFLRLRLSNTKAITSEANVRLRTAMCLQPTIAAGKDYPYALIGMAVDYRLRYFFDITSSRDFVAWHGARLLANTVWPRHSSPVASDDRYELEELARFFAALDKAMLHIQPVGRLPSAIEDATLARYCIVLSLFEQVFRSGQLSALLFTPAARHSVAGLLAIPDGAWVADICQISRLFFDQHAGLLSRPCILNPTFAGSLDVGGADADLIVDGCLIDIKTTKATALDANWIRQLVGYTLLDYDDALAIRSVGLYLARHGTLLTWPVGELLHTLTADNSLTLAALRSEFRAICELRGQDN